VGVEQQNCRKRGDGSRSVRAAEFAGRGISDEATVDVWGRRVVVVGCAKGGKLRRAAATTTRMHDFCGIVTANRIFFSTVQVLVSRK